MKTKDTEVAKIKKLKRLRVAHLLALEFDYVPSRSVEDVEKIGDLFGVFEMDILDEFQGSRPDEIVNKMINIIDELKE